MYCPKCGTENDDHALTCVECTEVLEKNCTEEVVSENVPNYLVQSILVTLFCCLPMGIAAIVFAAQVNSKVQAGDISGAWESSRKAKMWCWWSFGLGVVLVVFQLISMIIPLIAAAAAEGTGY